MVHFGIVLLTKITICNIRSMKKTSINMWEIVFWNRQYPLHKRLALLSKKKAIDLSIARAAVHLVLFLKDVLRHRTFLFLCLESRRLKKTISKTSETNLKIAKIKVVQEDLCPIYKKEYQIKNQGKVCSIRWKISLLNLTRWWIVLTTSFLKIVTYLGSPQFW